MTTAAAPDQPHDGAMAQVAKFGRMIKFEHTLFALPFAMAAAAIAARGHGLTLARLGGIVVAMAGARTAAMGFNRIVDRHIDAKNPRTARREIPAGAISLRAAWTMTLAATALFVGAAAALGPLCLALSPVALFFSTATRSPSGSPRSAISSWAWRSPRARPAPGSPCAATSGGRRGSS